MSSTGLDILASLLEDTQAQLQEALERADYYESVYHTFFSGDVPQNASLAHMIIAKYGRQRLEELKKKPALLSDTKVG